jgi:hypothetical protein
VLEPESEALKPAVASSARRETGTRCEIRMV